MQKQCKVHRLCPFKPSSLFINFNDQNLWAETETETARAKSSCKMKTCCSRVGVLQTHHQKGGYLVFHTAKHKPQPLTSTSNTRYLQSEWMLALLCSCCSKQRFTAFVKEEKNPYFISSVVDDTYLCWKDLFLHFLFFNLCTDTVSLPLSTLIPYCYVKEKIPLVCPQQYPFRVGNKLSWHKKILYWQKPSMLGVV